MIQNWRFNHRYKFTCDSGAYSQDEHTSPNGGTFSGFFSAPLYQGLTWCWEIQENMIDV